MTTVVVTADLPVGGTDPLAAAGLEVVQLPGAVLLPHIGGATVCTRTAMARAASTAVVDVLARRDTAALVTPPPSTTGSPEP